MFSYSRLHSNSPGKEGFGFYSSFLITPQKGFVNAFQIHRLIFCAALQSKIGEMFLESIAERF